MGAGGRGSSELTAKSARGAGAARIAAMDIAALQERLRAFAAERGWEPFHTPKNLATALFVEAAELAEIFQWQTPEQSVDVAGDAIERERVGEEAADVLLYLAQLADATGVDLDTCVERKLAKNARKHPPGPPAAPGAPASARRGPERKVHVLVDWENVQPKEEDVRALVEGATDLWLFHGPTQKNVGAGHAGFGVRATPVRISRTGKNALDFHLAFYMGYIAARHPDARFAVLSNDNGYKPMLEHAAELGFDTVSVGFRKPRQAAATAGRTGRAVKAAKAAKTATSAKTAKTAKAAKASKTARTSKTAAESPAEAPAEAPPAAKRSRGTRTAKTASKTAAGSTSTDIVAKQAAKTTARTTGKATAKTTAKAADPSTPRPPAKQTRRARPASPVAVSDDAALEARSVAPAATSAPTAPAKATRRAPARTAASRADGAVHAERPIDPAALAARLAEQLSAMGDGQRPARRASLLRMIGSRLPTGTDEAARLAVLERLVDGGHVEIDAKGAVRYPTGVA